ncbi:MAG: response regulator transcription factor [Bacteroidales bacterium]|nr:response regulator transcription factor [Bacteroidales bacterium]
MKKSRILLVDDHRILIDGMRKLLPEEEFEVVAEATDGASALSILRQKMIDMLICDIQMPGMNGLELIREARKDDPGLKIVVLSMFDERSMVLEALQSGVNAYLLKNAPQDEMVLAIRRVRDGKTYFSQDISNHLLGQFDPEAEKHNLSKRELEILKMIAKEYSNKEIARQLFISERTVESHRKNIYRKTNTESIIGLIKYAIEHELV